MADNRKYSIAEIGTFTFFVACSIIISIFHEPWFDEAQAWQIAKCASYKDILFFIPHYEGHPPLWTLILSVPAKLGVPFEVGLKTIGLTISFINAYLIIFKSPFPKIVRLLLPFNFFLFYQYGVIVRPYGLMILFLILLAVLFPTKDSHPWHFTGVLMLLCLTHAYGIMIAGGIAICMVWDILKEKGLKGFISNIFKDQRIIALEVLLVIALLVIIDIMPREDTYATSSQASNSLLCRLICMLFTMIPDCLVFKSEWFYVDVKLLKYADISTSALISATIVGVMVWGVIWLMSSPDKFKYLILPYSFFAVFGAAVYMVAHHIGITIGILIFGLWIDFAGGNSFENWNKFRNRLKVDLFKSKFTKAGIVFLFSLCLVMPVYWTVSSSVNDIKNEYGYGRKLADFIKDYKLEELNIYTSWDASLLSDSVQDEDAGKVFVYSDPAFLAYFDENILNNVTCKDQAYKLHKITSRTEAKQLALEWSKEAAPDIIIGNVSSLYCNDGYTIYDYTVVYMAHANYYFKDSKITGAFPVYMRNDLLEKYGLEKVDTSDVFLSNYQITDEMREAYRNGELTADDIVNMTLGDWGKLED